MALMVCMEARKEEGRGRGEERPLFYWALQVFQ